MISLMRNAYAYAWSHSDDLSTQCGAVLIDVKNWPVVWGSNTFPPGLNSRELTLDREQKLVYIEHAERDVIYAAARAGIITQGLTMVAPWACCAPCARAIVLAGISKVVAHRQAYERTPERWRASIEAGLKILRAAGVEYRLLNAKIGHVQNLFDGETWRP